MKWIMIIFLVVISLYPMNYAKYNWSNKNKLGAIGVALLVILSVLLPTVMLFMR